MQWGIHMCSSEAENGLGILPLVRVTFRIFITKKKKHPKNLFPFPLNQKLWKKNNFHCGWKLSCDFLFGLEV